MAKVKPLGDRILVELEEDRELKEGGIIIPDTAREKPLRGRVIELGAGKLDDEGNTVTFNVKKGDTVLLPQYGGSVVKIDGNTYQIIREEDVLGVISQ